MKQIVIYYDQSCYMCQFLRTWFMKVKKENIEVVWRHYEDALVCGLKDYSCGESMKVQTEEGQWFQAFYAVRKLVGYSRFSLLSPVLYFPGVAFLGDRAYTWVAKNRYRLFGKDEKPD